MHASLVNSPLIAMHTPGIEFTAHTSIPFFTTSSHHHPQAITGQSSISPDAYIHACDSYSRPGWDWWVVAQVEAIGDDWYHRLVVV